MAIGNYIKEIGRGKDGARALTREQADDLFGQVLDGSVTDLEVGAFCLAMRIKGETPEEMAGFLDASRRRMALLPASSQPTVVIPSYNGARKLPLLTPLLALLLAREGVPVLVHGMVADPTGRITSAAIFTELGLPPCPDAATVAARWAAGQPAFIAIETLNRPLASLLAIRPVLGLRNSGHTVAKILPALPGALRVVNHTHPEYAVSLTQYLSDSRACAVLMRGTEGEPVADARRQPRMQVFRDGRIDAEASLAPQDGVLVELPVLPAGIDATTTAAHLREVLAGRQPVPAPIAQQLACLQAACAARRSSLSASAGSAA
jgi:anthranilate phosphoribosyltransferase